ncbi:hypothetical protein Rs2_00059 [Raphanus sativus]|uniref:Uncharacterized protein At3g43530-like n=1 Tax=Raphanus sativus TaxID=3726 RepID=A0A9W3DSV3_RAPSA|nr:uncharacterized protein At3g43530-like [Raphanus sativus]KAJ4914509.1 hypothetical protein Rs2_00059 [Raphanus sativus]
MSPKTRLAEMKEKEGVPEKVTDESPAKKKKSATESKKKAMAEAKKKDSTIEKRKAAVKKRREAMKRKRVAKKKSSEVEKKKRSETAEKRKRDSSADVGSSPSPTKRARNTASPPEHHGENSPTPSAELPSQVDIDGTPSQALPSQPQKSPIQAPTEADNPLQPPVSDTSRKSPSRHVNDNDEELRSNNRDSPPPEAAIDNEAQRMVGEESMAVEPMRPVGFFFQPSKYGTVCKLSSRCSQHDFLEKIDKFEESEKSWFKNHPQFKHLFHMDCCQYRKVQGLWMLLLRCMHTKKDRQAWFGVNGVPIRYSIREHALLSGLHCGTYPENYPSIEKMKFASKGRMKFATKHFKHLQKETTKKKGKKQGLRVTETDVLEKLLKMKAEEGSDERLKMAVLYFLTRVIRGRSRNGYFIEPFILQAVDDLDFCIKFPWGRYTFDDCMKEIFHFRDHFAMKELEDNMQWTFPGFINPLEILAFECIPVLRERFRDPDPNCLPDCPRMCKWKYKRTGTTGFPLEDIYQALGNTNVISSILVPQGNEVDLLYEIMDEGTLEDVELIDDSDKQDIAVDGWNRILVEPEGKIFWEDLFEMDVRTRWTRQQQSEPHRILEGHAEERVCEEPEVGGEPGPESVKELELRLNKRMDDGFALRDETIRLLAARVKELEQDKIQRENWSFQFGEYETGEASRGARRDNIGDYEYEKDGEVVAEKDGEKEGRDKDGEVMAEKDGDKEAEKDGDEQAEKDGEETEAEKEDKTEAEKDGENEGEIEAEKKDETETQK